MNSGSRLITNATPIISPTQENIDGNLYAPEKQQNPQDW